MLTLDNEIWDKLLNKTIVEILNETNTYIYKETNKNYIYEWHLINKEKMKEEISRIQYPDKYTSFLRNIYIIEDNEYYPIDEMIKEKLEERLYYAVKDINNDFKDNSKEEISKFLMKVSGEITERIDEKIENKTKEDIVGIL